ncbi:MAG: LptF/LptG family permease, partial [Halieaceae bacterium]|nr:LptF/LptG family permease [Halieaceae bacterium]
MKILRYLNREVLTHMMAVSVVLLVIIVSGRLVKYLAEAAAGDLSAGILLPVIMYRLPGFLELILPLGL